MSRVWKPSDCRREIEGCFCATGFDYEDMCPDCRDEPNRWKYSYCVCLPKEETFRTKKESSECSTPPHETPRT